MVDYHSNPMAVSSKNPWILLLALIAICIGGVLFIGNGLGLITATLVSGVNFQELQHILADPTSYPEQRVMFMLLQAMASIGGFIIAPLIFYYTLIRGNIIRDFLRFPASLGNMLAITVVMVFSFMIVNTIFIEWNANIQLPDSMAGVENWARGLEDSMKILTDYLTDFSSTGYFVLAMVVIAAIPAVGEELLFRGMFQNIFLRIFKNHHAAIWAAAFIFSAVHFQFFGFLPRLLLGALFGYLYVWTGNLLVPMVAHFTNNGISLLALYVHQKGITDIDVESTDAPPTIYILLFSALFVVTLLYFKKFLVKPDTQ